MFYYYLTTLRTLVPAARFLLVSFSLSVCTISYRLVVHVRHLSVLSCRFVILFVQSSRPCTKPNLLAKYHSAQSPCMYVRTCTCSPRSHCSSQPFPGPGSYPRCTRYLHVSPTPSTQSLRSASEPLDENARPSTSIRGCVD